jgi:hypothetical protein
MARYVLASITSAFVAAFCFQIVNYVSVGYLDPFAIIAFLITWLVGFGLSLLVGLAFILERSKKRT